MPVSRAFSACLGALVAVLLTACAPTPPPLSPPTPALVRVLATDLTEPLLADLAAAYATANPAVLIAPSLAPAASLAGELAAGRADLALAVEPPAEAPVEAPAGPSPDPALFASPVGYLSFQVVVNPGNPLAELDQPQVIEIFAGRLTEWGQVSRQPGQIQVVARAADSEAGAFFETQALGGTPVTVNALLAPTGAAMRALVAENPNAIGYLAAPEVDATVRPVRTRTAEGAAAEWRGLVVALAAAEPAGPPRDFVAWVQGPAGQAAVAQRHASLDP